MCLSCATYSMHGSKTLGMSCAQTESHYGNRMSCKRGATATGAASPSPRVWPSPVSGHKWPPYMLSKGLRTRGPPRLSHRENCLTMTFGSHLSQLECQITKISNCAYGYNGSFSVYNQTSNDSNYKALSGHFEKI